MQGIWRLYRKFQLIKLSGAILSGISIFLMMCIVVVDVISRNFLSGSISGIYEIAQNYLMPLAVFPALAFVYSSGIMPRMDLAVSKVRKEIQYIAVNFILVLELILFIILIYYSFGYAMTGLQNGDSFSASASLWIVYPFYFLVPLGFAIILIEVLFIISRNIIEKQVLLTMKDEE